MLIGATIFRNKTRKLWDRYNAYRYKHVDGEYHEGFPTDLPVIDEISHYPSEKDMDGDIELK